MGVKWVKRKSDGVIIDVPDGHWTLNSEDYEAAEDPNKPKPAASKKPTKTSAAKKKPTSKGG